MSNGKARRKGMAGGVARNTARGMGGRKFGPYISGASSRYKAHKKGLPTATAVRARRKGRKTKNK